MSQPGATVQFTVTTYDSPAGEQVTLTYREGSDAVRVSNSVGEHFPLTRAEADERARSIEAAGWEKSTTTRYMPAWAVEKSESASTSATRASGGAA